MNYLAHCYLSFGNKKLLIGNIIGDFVKGKQIDAFEGEIKEGIILHRKIDEFTDRNEHFKKSVYCLDDKFGKYRFVIADILYDYLLAKNWKAYSTTNLKEFSQDVYNNLDVNYKILPHSFKKFFNYMKSDDLLYNYKNINMIRRYLIGVSRRCKYSDNLELSLESFIEKQDRFEEHFNDFMKEIIEYVQSLKYSEAQ